jgi:hypothetical protein
MKTIPTLLVLGSMLMSGASYGAAPAPAHKLPVIAAASATELPNKGKVISTIDVNQYTYIEVAQDKKVFWLAAPTVALKKNQMIRFEDGAEMSNFRSATLNRTFPSISFIGRVMVVNDSK